MGGGKSNEMCLLPAYTRVAIYVLEYDQQKEMSINWKYFFLFLNLA